ncbi:putative MFS family arabinose efflux permease [Herbihabitans rhizosphaerae]|uniref:Putative MFS family arabinose efflux permease n=1 Tax=Herbihabitans rhizosphaerae TaxID=1872711 RepID=A0A4Q7KJC1_9PSEU|nr:MFS transporter [Herbihabitans rhizosphaerae]RZS34704.1 putative MFS family arabinose efflux permease [Herbihabitans rhizosphaerae]
MLAEPRTTTLPVSPLLALATTVFLGCLTEVLPAGLLLGMSESLAVSPSVTGQLVTVYAITTALTAIPLTALTLGVPRKSLLLVLVVGFLLTNLVVAISSWYPLVLAARIGSGAVTGVMWSLVAGYAMRMAPPGKAGKALALAMAGTPVGFAVGVPAGTVLGELVGWRWAFAIMGLITVPLLVWVIVSVPPYPGEARATRTRPHTVLRVPGLRPVLLIVLAFSLGHNVFYTYLGPVLADVQRDGMLGVTLLVFGACTVAGLLMVGTVLDRRPRAVLGTCGAGTVVGIALLGIGGGDPATTLIAAGVWGVSFGGAPTAFQGVTAMVAGPTSDAAQSMTIATWNGAVAGGAFLGGVILDGGAAGLPWAAAGLVALSVLVVAVNRRLMGGGTAPSTGTARRTTVTPTARRSADAA